MLSLYEILKASKTGIAPDMWTALAGMNWSGADSGHEVKELTGIPPLSFTADGTPLLDYLISGNMSQTGTPSTTTPIQPSECGERTGQIIEYPYFDKSGVISGVQWTISENGHIKGIGTTSSGTNFFLNRNCFLKAGTYTLKIYGKHEGMELRIYDSGNTTTITTIPRSNTDSFVTFTLDSDTSNENRIYFNVGNAGIAVDIDCDIMLNLGSTALPYEPYGYKIPISSANTTTPVYLGEVETTRKIKKYEFTGSETWNTGTENYYSLVPQTYGDSVPYSAIICSHCINATINNTGKAIFFKKTDFPDITTGEELKRYCANQYTNGTPVTVWYVLATPETAVVNEPIRKIGNYADTISMEQAGVQIPTNRGNTVIDVETELKPSEMYIKYQE